MLRRNFLQLSALGALPASLGLSHNAFAQAKDTIQFGCPVPMSGAFAANGKFADLGMKLAIEQYGKALDRPLAYTLLVYVTGTISRRLLWFSSPIQALHLLPLFALAHGVQVLLRVAVGGIFPGPLFLVAPVIETVLWPVISVLLLAPQRRAPDSDENRPL